MYSETSDLRKELKMAVIQKYEYIRIKLDFGDLSELNRYSNDGWQVVTVVTSDPVPGFSLFHWALLERPIPN
jgi:hypothetical protein